MRALEAVSAWPAAVWDSSLLRGLDARGRFEVEAAGRSRQHVAGDALFRTGDPADSLFVVVSGTWALVGVRRGDGEASVVRRVGPGDVLGEDAVATSFSTRRFDARCEASGVVAEIPVFMLRRALVRASGADALTKLERALRRASTLDLLRTAMLTRTLDASELDVVLDATRYVEVARGEHVYREGDRATDAYLIVDGLVQLQTTDDGKPRIEAYLGRGDLFGDEELAERSPRMLGAVAGGPTALVALSEDVFVPLARKHPDLVTAARRVRGSDAALDWRLRPGHHTTAHVFRDLYRMRVARSLLVIDQSSCIRCGHCAWSCASVHDDGMSRLVRHGDTLTVNESLGETTRTAPLLVPNSCQHCKNPSCMVDCPTGAIGRNARGEVFIREDLCTGCGKCAKACPWDNIQMAPRPDGATFPAVAVKCDLCASRDGGPACVASCPTQAIARIDPTAAIESGLRSATSEPILPARVPGWPWVTAACLVGVGSVSLPLGRWTSGLLAMVLVVLLGGYAALKRVLLLRGLARTARARPIARWLYVSHLALGCVAAGVLLRHAGARLSGSAGGALAAAMALSVLTGAFGGVMAAVVPRALARVERKSVLAEELGARARELEEQLFAKLSGKTELVKTLFVTTLGPYRQSWGGPLFLLGTRRSLRDEEKALRELVDRQTGGKSGPSMAGMDELVRIVVELRAIRLQRWLSWCLRGWLWPHVAVAAAAVVLLVVHVAAVTWSRR